jgi:DNA-binding CsgD family transcriptional regulator
VDHHLQSIYRKLVVRSRTELAILLNSSSAILSGACLSA